MAEGHLAGRLGVELVHRDDAEEAGDLRDEADGGGLDGVVAGGLPLGGAERLDRLRLEEGGSLALGARVAGHEGLDHVGHGGGAEEGVTDGLRSVHGMCLFPISVRD